MERLEAALAALNAARADLAGRGSFVSAGLLACAGLLVATALVPALRKHLGRALAVTVAVLVAGEALLAWFHLRVYDAAVVLDPMRGVETGRVAIPLWVESEKLYVWALIVGVLALALRDGREALRPPLAVALALLVVGAVLSGRPFSEPVPRFVSQYTGYVEALRSGNPWAAVGAFRGLESARRHYYNAWYMWVHPPLLFASYGAFVVSFAAALRVWLRREDALEPVAGWWARLGYLPLTAGMLLGFPWALLAWDPSWWWSGKVSMSLMMWLLYTAYLHARLHLKRPGMRAVVLALAVIAFLSLVLTYVATYLVPGAHSVA